MIYLVLPRNVVVVVFAFFALRIILIGKIITSHVHIINTFVLVFVTILSIPFCLTAIKFLVIEIRH